MKVSVHTEANQMDWRNEGEDIFRAIPRATHSRPVPSGKSLIWHGTLHVLSPMVAMTIHRSPRGSPHL